MIINRTNMFQERKSVHINLDKDVHLAFRTLSFKYNLSMQEIFDEFAKLVASDNRAALNIIERLVMKKVNDIIEGKKKEQYERIRELDHTALYDLISQGDKEAP